MDLVLIPQALFVFYGGLVLVCGGVLGFIVGRNLTKRRLVPAPPTPELLERRVAELEEGLHASEAELKRLVEEREFMRQLKEPPPAARGHVLADSTRLVA